MPSDKEIADAVRTLAKVGINPLTLANTSIGYNNQNSDLMQMQMLMGMNNSNSRDMTSMLPYFMNLQRNTGNNNFQNNNSDLMKTFMMNNLMNDMNSSFFTDDTKNTY